MEISSIVEDIMICTKCHTNKFSNIIVDEDGDFIDALCEDCYKEFDNGK